MLLVNKSNNNLMFKSIKFNCTNICLEKIRFYLLYIFFLNKKHCFVDN